MKSFIPAEPHVFNDKIKVYSRIHKASCYLYYHINDVCFYSHDVKSIIGLRVIISQLVITKLVNITDLEGFLGLDIETINTWVDTFKTYGSKSFCVKNKKKITCLSDDDINFLQRILDKDISIREIEYLQCIDHEIICKTLKEKRLEKRRLNDNNLPSNEKINNGHKGYFNPKNLIHKQTGSPKVAFKIYL